MSRLHVTTENDTLVLGREQLGQRSGVTSPFPTRYERLEEQLNDLTELHQNEMTNLKQELASMEEKVAYQSYERARDIQVQPGPPWGWGGRVLIC